GVEGCGPGRLVAVVIDLQRSDGAVETGHCREGHRGAVRRLQIDARQIVRADLKVRLRLENDLIVVHRAVDGGDLPHAERVVELLSDLIDSHSVNCRLFAIDVDSHLRIGDVKISVDVQQAVYLENFVSKSRRKPVKLRSVIGLQGVLVVAFGELTAEIDVLDRLEIDRESRHDVSCLAQTRPNGLKIVAL